MRAPSDLAYRADVLKLLKRVQQIILAELEPWVRENTRSDARTDSKEDELRLLFERARVKTSEYVSRAAPVVAGRFVKVGAETNRAAMNAQFRSVIKIDPFISNKGLETSMRARLATNVELINSLPSKLVEQVESVVGPRVFSGVRVEETMKAIQERFDVSASRAQLIARDQTNKFNAQLTQERHEDLGIDSYVWSTSNDERVRDDHIVLDGETFSYDNPPVVDSRSGATANPGEDYQCRCEALPRVDAVLDALGVPDVADVGADETSAAVDEAASVGDEPLPFEAPFSAWAPTVTTALQEPDNGAAAREEVRRVIKAWIPGATPTLGEGANEIFVDRSGRFAGAMQRHIGRVEIAPAQLEAAQRGERSGLHTLVHEELHLFGPEGAAGAIEEAITETVSARISGATLEESPYWPVIAKVLEAIGGDPEAAKRALFKAGRIYKLRKGHGSDRGLNPADILADALKASDAQRAALRNIRL